jgi:hypothetical protein
MRSKSRSKKTVRTRHRARRMGCQETRSMALHGSNGSEPFYADFYVAGRMDLTSSCRPSRQIDSPQISRVHRRHRPGHPGICNRHRRIHSQPLLPSALHR